MGLYPELPLELNVVDIIIAGGGTAGCIVASRLADADPNLSILVVEAGPDGVGNANVDYPVFFLGNILPTSAVSTFYKSKKSSSSGNRDIFVSTANVLGGGSATNMMHYSRAQRSDWDSWNVPGWSADELLPYMKKLESYHGPGSMDDHGTDGPIQVSTGTYASPRIQDQCISAMNELGWPEIDDFYSAEVCDGVQRPVRYISRDGKRQDTASRYLRPRLEDGKHPNLHVVVGTKVIKVLMEGERATGIVLKGTTAAANERTIRSNKLVIVSAGAFGTPAILERSGVGSAEVLERAGVPQVVNLPGVGREYEDHSLVIYSFKSALEPEETIDGILRGKMNPDELIQSKHSILGWNAQEAALKIRPNEKDIATFSPEFKEHWDREYRNKKDKPLIVMALICAYPGVPTGVPEGQYFGMTVFTTDTLSKGHLHITGPGLDDPVDFDVGCLSDEKQIDLQKHRWAYKKHREIARRIGVFRGEYAPDHPPFPSSSKAACVELDSSPQNMTDIEYSADDDAIIDDWVRNKINSTWHSLGTCKMAPVENYGVVGPNLSVHGIQGLKLADLSIAPKNVAANTNHTALVIGEKAADIIIKELNL
ncbi:unnamed protein product [Clonostachys rosea]|uniref:Glucose-methanol-choline oxidoreductase N-terminal domain-containing protein n=1 Tax=Bionectria ochroleuca TaxID=29856 RepID=A0ABY6TP59_BIOOC|nr:unnamed protein product [Clonostachys rosea]